MRIFVSRRVGPFNIGASFGSRDFRHRRFLNRRTARSSDHIYVVQGRDAVKIGVTSNLEARLAQLQTGSSHRLSMVYSTQVQGDAYAIEAEAHAMLDRHRASGEWFHVPPDVAVAAINGAAFRLSAVAEDIGQSPISWLKRTSIISLAMTPMWAAISAHQVVLFVIFAAATAIGLLRALMQTEVTAGSGAINFIFWCGAIMAGMFTSIFAGSLIALIISNVVLAEERPSIPILDSSEFCTKSTAMFGNNPIFKDSCMENEAASKSTLDRLWAEARAKDEITCINFLKATPVVPSYQGLQGCLSMAVSQAWVKGELKLVPK